MRHSMSEGGRAFPPPKYCSYSIFSWRMSLSSCARSSSVVLAMECGPQHHSHANWIKKPASTRTPRRGAEQVMFLGHSLKLIAWGISAWPTDGKNALAAEVRSLKFKRGSFPSPFQQN